jgi:hypothetical protein
MTWLERTRELGAKATPTPWEFLVETAPKGDMAGIMINAPIQTPRGQMVLSCNGLPSPGEMQATSALAVHLANTRTRLEALVEAATAFHQALDKSERGCPRCKYMEEPYTVASIPCELEAALAALNGEATP